eukprot:6208873-Pleurochrysis_carterae.AAC.1
MSEHTKTKESFITIGKQRTKQLGGHQKAFKMHTHYCNLEKGLVAPIAHRHAQARKGPTATHSELSYSISADAEWSK